MGLTPADTKTTKEAASIAMYSGTRRLIITIRPTKATRIPTSSIESGLHPKIVRASNFNRDMLSLGVGHVKKAKGVDVGRNEYV